jgi:hypothetical protein
VLDSAQSRAILIFDDDGDDDGDAVTGVNSQLAPHGRRQSQPPFGSDCDHILTHLCAPCFSVGMMGAMATIDEAPSDAYHPWPG